MQDDLVNKENICVESFEEIYNLYHQFVFNVCIKMLYNIDEAEDALQDVFVRVHKNLDSFRGEANIKTWLYKVTVNTCLNIRKSKKQYYRKWLKAKNNFKLSVRDKQESVIDDIEAKELLYQLLEQLPVKEKVCILLKEIESLSYKEICDILGISLGTCKSRLSHARQKLISLVSSLEKESDK